QLGDGRALLLGQVPGTGDQSYEIQLKGAGLTPYSRTLDGRFPLGPALREYLCGEALTALGIASTRGLCVLGSRTEIRSDPKQSAAILVRMAKSHIRFGHFEFFHHRDRFDELRELFVFVIERHFSECLNESAERRPLWFLETVIKRTAALIAEWQSIGFVHGVMNTDNMTISGETLDLGPFGFVEAYDPEFSPNPADDQNRYQFDQQPDIGRWNCLALAQAMTSLLPSPTVPASLLRLYRQSYQQRYLQCMRLKLGLYTEHPGDIDLINSLLSVLTLSGDDYPVFFRKLADFELYLKSSEWIKALGFSGLWQNWLDSYRQRLGLENLPPNARRERMNRVNPCYVLRAHLLNQAIENAERGDISELDRLLGLLQNPYEVRAGMDFHRLPPVTNMPPASANG
ncbi:MAG: protein adenylyltransferase SelO family protein, partial [Methylococcaceae bacterium]